MDAQTQGRSGEKPSKVTINRAWCKGCRICAAFCPMKALDLDEEEKAVLVSPERCEACGLCALRCPDMAIELDEDT